MTAPEAERAYCSAQHRARRAQTRAEYVKEIRRLREAARTLHKLAATEGNR
ncbi:MAG: hypothetical protein HUU17_12925 [Chthonomonadales bacterium]|nr:hypothetical protein [Chthonomonadales bacterium]